MPQAEQGLNELLHEIRRAEQSREILTEKKIRKIYKQLLKELNHFLADEYVKYSQEGKLTVAMLQEKSRYAKFLEEIEANVNNLTPEIAALIRKTVEDTYTACYKGMSDAVLNAEDTKSALRYLKDLSVRPEVMKRAIENPVSGLILPDILERNRREVIYDIKQQINISLMNGDRYETTAKKITEKLDMSYAKAVNIVRTETHRVTESGFIDSAKDINQALDNTEFVYTAVWRTMKDERVRPQQRYHTRTGWKTSKSKNGANHQKMEGTIIQAGGRFELEPGVYAECPGTSGTARNDCRCRCFLEYELLTVEEFAEKSGKNIDVPTDNMQNYKPVIIDLKNQNTVKKNGKSITVSRLSNTNNKIYISNEVKIKPKQQQELDRDITAVLDILNVKDKSIQPMAVVISDYEMANNAVASYNPVKNVVYIRQTILDYNKLIPLQEQLACPKNKYSTLLHEYIHWSDAEKHRKKYSDFANADDFNRYIKKLRNQCKAKLDKAGVNGYNIKEISNYAVDKYASEEYDECYTEYRVKQFLRR